MTSRVGKPDTPADVQLRALLDAGASTGFVMVAGAGSGKTTSIVKALDHLRVTRGSLLRQRSQKIACITYTELAVAEIWGDVGNDPLFHVSTIHSFLWTALKPFQADIALWVDRRLDQKIEDTEQKIAAFTTRTQAKTRIQAAGDVERYREQKKSIKSVALFNYGVGSDYASGVLGHDDVIKLSTELIQKHHLIAKVVGQKFPYIFVDESQDTVPDVVAALKAISRALGPKFCLGFIGDPMQKIYTTGAGAIEPLPDWKVIEKPENFRCPITVLKVINNIRAGGDGLVQTGGKSKLVGDERVPVEGTARIFVVPKDNRKERLSAIRKWLADKNDDPLWLSDAPDADVKVLVIAHRMAASRLGFGRIYEAFHDKTSETTKDGFDEGTHWSVQPFLKLMMPLVLAHEADDQFQVMNLFRKYSPSLQRDYLRSNSLPKILKELDTKGKTLAETCGRTSTTLVYTALKHIADARMFRLDDRLVAAMAEYNDGGPPTDSGDVSAVQKLLHAPVSELWGYRTYVEEQSPFETHQGVKGAEFARVLTIIDDEEGRHNQFSYGKLFGITPPSDTDEANVREGKETTLDRTRRLLYVCCSRAGQDLAVAFFADDPTAAHKAIVDLNLFPAEDVHNHVEVVSHD
ncbi:UvrD-helicase domain-containing protein [Prosthecomicrobium sp. N25]|uniref:UvrD-helicase domain-containing protein n=1 Tax=Prosthecomicrobium sp. N25 TaxID=3129254 RepID=UPI003077C6E3